jgi:ankyrin repeat protein
MRILLNAGAKIDGETWELASVNLELACIIFEYTHPNLLVDKQGRPVLFKVIEDGNWQLFEFLINKRIAVNLMDKQTGDTPLHLLSRMQNSPIMIPMTIMLLQVGGDITTKNAAGKIPRKVAEEAGNIAKFDDAIAIWQASKHQPSNAGMFSAPQSTLTPAIINPAVAHAA